MKLATTTSDFVKYTNDQETIIRNLVKCGFKYIDYSFGIDYKNRNGFFGDFDAHAKKMMALADELGIKFVQSHAPMGTPIVKNEKYESFIECNITCIKACAKLKIPYVVVHSGYDKHISKEECFKRNKEFYDRLLPYAEKYSVEILTENFNKMWDPETFWIDNAPELRELVDHIDHPMLNVCWDIGHGNLQSMPQHEAMKILGDKIHALHVQDNYNRADSHKAPFFGTTNWDSVMYGLKEIGFNGYFTFEADNLLTAVHNKRTFDKDTRLMTPPIEFQLRAESLLYDIGKYILSSYDCFEE